MPMNWSTGQSYGSMSEALNAPQSFSKPDPKWAYGGAMPAQQQGKPWSAGIAKTHSQGLDGLWYDPKAGYTATPPPSGFTPVGYGGAGGPGGAGGGITPMGGGVGGGGGAPQGPYGGFMTGTPNTLEEGREMAYTGTLDPVMGFYQNAGGFQDVLRREVARASGQDRVDYGPLRAEAADQAGRASQLMGERGRMQAGRANLNYGPGQQHQATQPVREQYGRSMRDIGYQEKAAQRQLEQAANQQLGAYWGMQGAHATGAAGMKLNQLNQLEETAGVPTGLFGKQSAASYGTGNQGGLGGLKGPASQNVQQANQYSMWQNDPKHAMQYMHGKSLGWWD